MYHKFLKIQKERVKKLAEKDSRVYIAKELFPPLQANQNQEVLIFMDNQSHILQSAREVLQIEIDGIAAVRDRLGESFVRLVEVCREKLDGGGKIVVTGIGK